MNHMEPVKEIYLAGPFFNPQQVADQERVEAICRKHGWKFFSPRLECLVTPESTKEEWARTFRMNVQAIRRATLVFANVEGYDTGTLWEMGAAYEAGRTVVIYSPNPQRRLNLMLAMGAHGFVAGWNAIESFLKPQPTQEPSWGFAEAKWNQEVI